MKSHVQVLVQPRWTQWQQDFALRNARNSFRKFLWDFDNRRWADGLPGYQKSKPLDYPQIRDWLSDRYIELRGAYKIRMDYAEFERLLLQHGEIGDEWRNYRRFGWGAAGCPYREGWSYVRNVDHEPKQREPNAWHIERKHKRDKARHGGGCMRRGCSRRRFWVREQAREHRAWCKQMIKKENWDAFGRGADDSEYTVNPWLWD